MISFRLRTKWQKCRGYVPSYERTPKIPWLDIHSVFATHVETVVLLDREKVNDKEREYVYVDYEPKDNEYLKLINMTGKATYKEISEWIDKNYGLNVSNLYIAQVKDKCGFEKKENTNKGTKGSRVPKVTPEKEEAIIAAFRHFNMV